MYLREDKKSIHHAVERNNFTLTKNFEFLEMRLRKTKSPKKKEKPVGSGRQQFKNSVLNNNPKLYLFFLASGLNILHVMRRILISINLIT